MEDKKVRVLLEDIRSQFRIFGEGIGGLNEKLERMDKKFDLKIEKLEKEIALIKMEIFKLKQDLRVTKEMTAKNSENIEIMKSDIQFIKMELKKFTQVDEFEALSKRVLLLEKKLSRA